MSASTMANQASDAAADLDVLERAPLVRAPPAGTCLGKSSSAYGAAVAAPADGASGAATKDELEISPKPEDELIPASAGGRAYSLDAIRIICIWLVCVDHAGTPFGVWNTMYVQSWVLQYLFIISGICFGMTSKGLSGFLGRLGMYFLVGVACNWTAWLIIGLNWRGDFWNVIFQFWFIVALVGFILLLSPLKANLSRVRESLRSGSSSGSIPGGYLTLLVGYIAIGVFFAHVLIPILQWCFSAYIVRLVEQGLGPAAVFWGFPTTEPESRDFIMLTMSYFQLSVSNMYLVLAFPLLSHDVSNVAWLVILNTYAHKMILYRAQMARMINGFDCMMLGLVCYYYGIKHRQKIGEYIVRYWFVCLFLCAVLYPPGTYGRFDESPPRELLFRMQYNLLECFFVVLFLTASERMIDPKIFTEDRLEFLGNWALLLFLVHKAVHLLATPPLNYTILIALAYPCYLLHQMKRPPARSDAEAPKDLPAPEAVSAPEPAKGA